jgi:hypothetical protein
LEWDNEQWGEVPELDSSFDEVGDYKHRVIVQHLAYFHRQDVNLIDDVIDLCVLDAQTPHVPHEPVFYDALETELAILEGIPPAPAPSGPMVISKSLAGLVQTLSTLPNMLIFLEVHYLRRPLSPLTQH